MKITIRPTEIMTTVNGRPARLWDGLTDGGVRCQVYVAAIAVPEGQDESAFAAELGEMPPPREAVPLGILSPARGPAGEG